MLFIIYAPASILFVMAPRAGRRLFSPAKLVILAVSIVGVVALATGWTPI